MYVSNGRPMSPKTGVCRFGFVASSKSSTSKDSPSRFLAAKSAVVATNLSVSGSSVSVSVGVMRSTMPLSAKAQRWIATVCAEKSRTL